MKFEEHTGEIRNAYEEIPKMDKNALSAWMISVALSISDELKNARNSSLRYLISEAKNIVRDMLENGEIIMGEGYFDRKIYNANSKRLTDDLNINVKYDSKKQRVYITDGSEEVFEGFCFDVADLIYEFRVFGRGRLEDLEMTWDEPKKEEISI